MKGLILKTHMNVVEADVTFWASVELDYLLNIITFDYESLKCKYM